MSNARALQPPDVVGPGEARHIIARESPRGTLSRTAFKQHVARPEFPPPAILTDGYVWERRAVIAYARQRYTGKPYLTALELWRMTDPAASIYTRTLLVATGLSAEQSVSHTTVKRYLQQLGEITR